MITRLNLFALCCIMVLITVTLPQPVQQSCQAQLVTDQQVQEAIEKLRKWIYSKQKADGSWPVWTGHREEDNKWGPTTIAATALLMSGSSPQNPKLSRTLQLLRDVNVTGTYTRSLRAHVWGQLPPEYLEYLKEDTAWLLQHCTKDSQYSYAEYPGQSYDHSNSQYGNLGVWEGSKRGIRINPDYWKRAIDHWIKAQYADGGWSYRIRDGAAYGAMSAAGLTALYVAQQELFRRNRKPDPELYQAIQKGVGWFDKHFKGAEHAGRAGFSAYYLYGVERIGLASGRKYFNGQDWFEQGAHAIVQRVSRGLRGDSPNTIANNCFMLMFLARGRQPVWCSKIQIKGVAWNNKPNDLYFLSRYLSEQREHELNWWVVDINQPRIEWLHAPIAMLASDDELELDEKQKAALKQFIDLGGLLWLNPDNGSRQFKQSAHELIAELYPQYIDQRRKQMPALEPEHPIFNILHRLPRSRQPRVFGISNGARDLVVMPNDDWSYTFQSDEPNSRDPEWQCITNLYVLATDRGVLRPRLVAPFDITRKKPSGQVVIGRARYDGNWLPESAPWTPVHYAAVDKSGKGLAITASADPSPDVDAVLDLEDLGAFNGPLTHLTGVDAFEMTESHKQAIKQYVQRGGTILVETVGGKGEFARAMEMQLLETMGTPLVIQRSHPILSGQDINGFDVRRVNYRKYSVITMSVRHTPRLAAFMHNDRPAIIITNEDLSLGALGVKHWGLVGYAPDSARQMLANIALWAGTHTMAEVEEEPAEQTEGQ